MNPSNNRRDNRSNDPVIDDDVLLQLEKALEEQFAASPTRKLFELIDLIRDSQATKPNALVETAAPDRAFEESDEDIALRSIDVDPLIAGEQATGKSFGRFEIIEKLGQGGHGMVFLAHDPKLDRNIALKIPRPEFFLTDERKQRFEQEARAAAALSHPNIVPVFESGDLGIAKYLACEYIPGKTLAEWTAARTGSVDTNDAVTIVIQLAEALQHAHQRGVLHRDIKPGNILIRTQDSGLQPLIADFGLATIVDQEADLTQTGAIVGTPSYLSPEQARGDKSEIGPATDVYGLGAILYELLTGKPPFHEETVIGTIQAVINSDPIPPRQIDSNIPRDLEAICLKCLEKQSERRYQSAFDLQSDLERFRDFKQVSARRMTPAERLLRWSRRNPKVASLSAVLAGTVIVGLISLTFLWLRAENNRQLAQTNESRYLKKSEQLTEAVNRLFVSIANSPELQNESAEGLRRTLLQEARRFQEEFLTELPDDPETKFQLAKSLKLLAEINLILGDYQNAKQLTQAALKHLDDVSDSINVTSQLTSANVLLGRSYTYLGDFDLATSAFEQAYDSFDFEIDNAEEQSAAVIAQKATVLAHQAFSLHFQDEVGKSHELAKLAETLWKILETLPVDPHHPVSGFLPQRAMSRYVFAETLRESGKFDEADRAYTEAMKMFVPDPDRLVSHAIWFESARCLYGSGLCQANQNNHEDARTTYQACFKISNQLAADHPLVEKYASFNTEVRYSMATNEMADQMLDEAERLIRENIEDRNRLIKAFPETKGKSYSFLGDNLNILYVIIYRQGKADEGTTGEDVLLHAIDAFKNSLAENPDWSRPQMAICRTYLNLGFLYYRQGKRDEALTEFKRARAGLTRLVEAEPNWADAVSGYFSVSINLISYHRDHGNFDEAIVLVDDLIKRFPKHPRIHSVMLGKTVLLAQAGELGRAEERLLSFAKDKASSHKDFISAAEKAIAIANLKDVEVAQESLTHFEDVALQILRIGKPTNAEALDTYLNALGESEKLTKFVESIR